MHQPVLAPGTILQLRYVRSRLRMRPPGRFIDVGTGTGELAAVLLSLGWTGIGYDLSEEATARALQRNHRQVSTGHFRAVRADFLEAEPSGTADAVVSQMVLEHLDDADVGRYFDRVRKELNPSGVSVLLVPAAPARWGIEDEIAGHYRRYTRETLTAAASDHGFSVTHVAGLTYPISNLLLPLSDAIVARAERSKASLSMTERTSSSGVRDVAMKTAFPSAVGLILNERALAPLDALQRMFRGSPRALVLYAEAIPSSSASQLP